MMRLTRAILLASIALFSLALLASSASANRSIEIEGLERGRAISLTSEGALTFTEGGGATERCNVTLSGTIGRLIAKNTRLPEGQIGSITSGRSANCIGPAGERTREVIILAEPRVNVLRRPFPLRYNSFLGTLPRINGLLFVILTLGYTFFPFGLSCLYQWRELKTLISFTGELPRSERGRFLENVGTLVRELSEAICPTSEEFVANWNITPQLILNLR